MTIGFYSAFFDPMIVDQWYLSAPLDRGGGEIHAARFASGRPYLGTPPCSMKIYQAGIPVEVSFGRSNVPVVSDAARFAIESVATQDCEFFPIDLPGTGKRWHILNAISLVDCFDVDRSVFEEATGEGDEREYDSVWKVVIDPVRAAGHDLFRIRGYDLDLIVSERVKVAIESLPRHGVCFTRVTP